MRCVRILVLSAVLISGDAALIHAEDINGTVVIWKKLTKPRVTASVSMYERGPAVELAKDPETDPIAFERSRVVVYIEAPPAAAPPAEESIVESIFQNGRRFTPDLVVIPVGSSVSFPNEDPIFHNVFSLSKAKSFDLGNYPKGETRKVEFNKPGIVYVNCHLHPNMAATVVVTPNRWYSKVDPSGQFSLRGVPPGNWSIVAWHKAAGFVRQSVRVTAGKNATLTFVVPLADDPPGPRAAK